MCSDAELYSSKSAEQLFHEANELFDDRCQEIARHGGVLRRLQMNLLSIELEPFPDSHKDDLRVAFARVIKSEQDIIIGLASQLHVK